MANKETRPWWQDPPEPETNIDGSRKFRPIYPKNPPKRSGPSKPKDETPLRFFKSGNAKANRKLFTDSVSMGGERVTGLAKLSGSHARKVLLNLVGEAVPGATYIPAVRRQMDENLNNRFNEWYNSLPDERKQRLHELYKDETSLWGPGGRDLYLRREFEDMPGGPAERERDRRVATLVPFILKSGGSGGLKTDGLRKVGVLPIANDMVPDNDAELSTDIVREKINGYRETQQAADAGDSPRRSDMANFLATDEVPESLFGIPIVASPEQYTQSDIEFFKSHPRAGGFYELGEDTP